MLYEVITNSYEERAFQYGVKLTIPDFPASVDEIKAVEAETVQDFKDLGDKIAGMNVNDLTFENTFQARITSYNVCYTKLLRNRAMFESLVDGCGMMDRVRAACPKSTRRPACRPDRPRIDSPDGRSY